MRPKTCKNCKSKFQPERSFQDWCCFDCGVELARKRVEAKKKKEHKEARKEYRQAKKAQLTCSDWEKKVDAVYNKWIRLRDEKAGLPCPSCGRYEHEIPNTPWGKWDCGHYLSKGARPELRYEELNTWRQCKSCNGGSGKYARKNHTVSQSYRATLIKWIGLEKVEWLEGPHEPKRYRIDDYIELEKLYKQKLKEISK